MTKEIKELTLKSNATITIPDQTIEDMIALADDTCQWCKLTDGGFKFVNQDKIVPEIVGRMMSIQLYLINFEAGDRLPAKKPHVRNDTEIPEGYSRRCDIKLDVDGQLIGLSLAPSSIKFQLSPYLKYLKNQGLRPDQVITRVRSKQASNALGTFNVAVFEIADAERKEPSETTSDETSFDYPDEWA
jgi:hypothetical protein